MRLDCMLWIQMGACCLTAAELCWLSRNVGITLGSNNLENFGNLRMMLEHRVGVCLEKRTFQLCVSADHEKKYSRQAEKVKAPHLCWHRLQLISLSVGTSVQIRETPPVLPWALPGCYIWLPPATPSSVCQYFLFIKTCFCLGHWGPFLSTSDLCLAFGCDHNSLYPDRGHLGWPGELICNPGIPSHTAFGKMWMHAVKTSQGFG